MKALLIRVGIDKGAGGALGPLYPDGSFEYIPIPEDAPSKEIRRYDNCCGTNMHNKFLSFFMPKRNKNRVMHFDPEFETNTYGDYKSKRVDSLHANDIIAFYAGLEGVDSNWKRNGKTGLYLIGYLTVTLVVYVPSNRNVHSRGAVMTFNCENNAHFKREEDGGYYIVKGHKRKSGLLKKAVKISKPKLDVRGRPYHAVSPKFERLLGISGSIQRSVPVRVIKGNRQLANLRRALGLTLKGGA